MAFATKIDDEHFVVWPCHESAWQHGKHFSANVWPRRLSDCRVNCAAVNEIVYRRMKRGDKRRRPMTPDDLRFRLRCFIYPLSDHQKDGVPAKGG